MLFALLLLSLSSTLAVLPGVAPVEYMDGQRIPLKVNKVNSVRTQLPFKYYDLPFCRPSEGVKDQAENLGEILLGDRIENSDYEIWVPNNTICKVLCFRDYTDGEIKKFSQLIKDEYKLNWIVDGLPAATPKILQDPTGQQTTIYDTGFALGFNGKDDASPDTKDGVMYLNNHINIKLLYHINPEVYEGRRIVGFEVLPESIQHPQDFFNKN